MRVLLIALLLFISRSALSATVLQIEKVSVTGLPGYRGIESLRIAVSSFSGPDKYLMACAPVAELQETILCVSSSQIEMNRTFTRIGIFGGSGRQLPPGTLVSDDDSELRKLDTIIAGHNLQGSTISAYLATADLNSAESEFLSSFVRNPLLSQLNSSYYLIAVAIDSPIDHRKAIAHEIHHAKYYLDASFKTSVSRFWKEHVSDEDKSAIRRILGGIYNVSNEDLMIDEFQAYILQEDAEHAMLSQFAGKYRDALVRETLSAH